MTLDSVTNFLKVARFYILAAIVAVAIFEYGTRWKGCAKPVAPASVVPVEVVKPIVNTSPQVPEPHENQAGRIHVTLRDTVTKEDTVGAVHVREVTLWTNVDPKEPPVVTDAPPGTHVEYTPVREPYFDFSPKFHVGVSSAAGYPLMLSPYLGVSALTLFSHLDLGAQVDFYGLGLGADYAIGQVHLGVSYQLVKFSDGGKVRLTAGIAF